MKTMKFLKVTNVSEVKEDKNDVAYKTLRAKAEAFFMIHDPETNKMERVLNPAAKETAFNQWEKSYDSKLNGAPDAAYEAKVGSRLAGTIVTRKVPSYEITDSDSGEVKTVDSYTTAVFGDTSEEEAFEIATLATFKRNGHEIDGEAAVNINLEAVATEESSDSYSEENTEENIEVEVEEDLPQE